MKRFYTRNKEVGAALYGRESRKALYFLSNWTLWNRKVKRAILGTDHRIVFIAELMEIWVIDPNVLRKFELADKACAYHERRNPTLYLVLGRTFG